MVGVVRLACPVMGSSPTVIWRMSSTNAFNPSLKSSTSQGIIGESLVDRGCHDDRFDSAGLEGMVAVRVMGGTLGSSTPPSSSTENSEGGLAGDSRDRVRVCPPRMTRLRFCVGVPWPWFWSSVFLRSKSTLRRDAALSSSREAPGVAFRGVSGWWWWWPTGLL